MNKRKPREEKITEDIRTQFLNSQTGKDFVKWWRDHRYSGYATKGSQERWGIDPYTASTCARYMAEYCSDRGLGQELSFEYSAEDYEKWARDQKEADEAVALFAESHGGREVPTLDEFRAGLREALKTMRSNFESLSREAKQYPEPKYWDK